MGGSTLRVGVSMDTPNPRGKKIYNIIFYFFVYILRIMLIDGHPYLKGLNPPLIPNIRYVGQNEK